MKKTFVLTVVTALALGVPTARGDNRKTDSSVAETRATSSEKVTSRTMDEIKKPGVIRIGVSTDKVPFGYVDTNGVNQGYGVVYMQRITRDLGVRVEFTLLDPVTCAEYVDTGKVGITLANFAVTKGRTGQANFVKPYMKAAPGVVSLEKAVIHPADELEGKTSITAKGTAAETYFGKNCPEVKLRKYDICADAYNVLLGGRDDAFPTDNIKVTAWAKASPDLEVGIDNPGDYDTITATVAKGDETLLNFLNEEIVTLDKENFFHRDYDGTLKPVFDDAADPDVTVVEGGELGDTRQ